ncbi:hypothetical protein SUGI_0073300 [Cryptomeria japonica]|nr:hypothetical protein SUGI_0073300 [Cryptomeria japonica]
MGERRSMLSQPGERPWMGERERGTKRLVDLTTCECNSETLVVVMRKLKLMSGEVRMLSKLRKKMKWPSAM